jgi:hypothetical protein
MVSHSTAVLWGTVVASGLFHGVNPGMGWPLAVSAALFERRSTGLLKALAGLGAGHLLAMLVVLAPFSLAASLLAWRQQLQIGAAAILIGLGVVLLLWRRHPRFLQRVGPQRLILWSFLIATAHGAALMLLPIYVGLCASTPGSAHEAAVDLMRAGATQAVLVSIVHTLAMVAAGGMSAAGVYYWLGLTALSRVWINLDSLWAGSLIGVGALAIVLAAS